MKKKNYDFTDSSTLRQKAEMKLNNKLQKFNPLHSETDTLKLIHELEVHQIELEMQNEELTKANELAKLATEKYIEYYDFAPSGYVSLSKEGKILELNFSAAKMLGKQRFNLVNSHFRFFISEDSRNDFNLFFNKVFLSKEKETCEVIIVTEGKSPLYVLINGIVSQNEEQCFLTFVDITERRLLETNLLKAKEISAESEAKYRLLLENYPGGISIFEDNKIKYVSDGYLNLLGYDKDEIEDISIEQIFSFIPKDDLDYIKESIKTAHFNKTNKFQYTYRAKAKKGGYIWLEDVINAEYDSFGKHFRSIIYSRDITERKLVEETIRQSRNMLARTESISQIGSWEWDSESDIVTWSDELFRIFQRDPADGAPSFKEHHKLYYSDDMAKLFQAVQVTLSTGEPYEIELRAIRTDGETRVCLARGYSRNSNNFKHLYGSLQDITELKLAKLAIKESEEKYRKDFIFLHSILESPVDIIIFALDKNYCYTAFTKFHRETIKKIWGIDIQIGISMLDIILNPEDRQKAKNNFDRVLRGEYFVLTEEYGDEKLYRTYYENYYSPIKNSEESIVGISIFVIDVTERNKAEQSLKNSEIKLRELNSDKDRFISILAHDLKGPFNGILGLLGLLTDDFHKYGIATIERYIKLISNSAHNTYNLLEAILMWARSQSGKIPYEPQRLSLSDICDEVIEILKPNAKNKDIAIKFFASNEIHIFADKEMLNTILRNLISNAIKFTNNGGHIDVFAEHNSSDVTIKISDNGVGMDADTVTKLFDISQKFSASGTANEKGTGLGLILCKDFIEKHGGKIWIESEVGKGSDFIFTIPLFTGQVSVK